MAYDFSKKTVSAKDLSKKRSDAVAASRKSKSKNNTVDAPEPITEDKISGSWEKDVVTLDEAKQQTKEAGSYLQAQDEEYRESQGIVQTVDTQKAGISESWNKDTVTLAEAQAQTGEAQRYVDAKTDQTNESMNDQDDVDQEARELPEYIDKDSELGRAAVASGQYRETERTGPSTVEIIRGMQPGGDRLERMAALLGVRGESSGSGDYGTDVSKGPLYVKTVTEGKSISQQMQGLFREGQEAGRGEGGISLQLDRNDYSTTSGLYERAEGAAGFVVDKFDTSTQKAVDKIPVPTIRKGVDTLQNVSVGAMEAVGGTVPLVAGVPMVGEVLIKEPKKFAQAIPTGLGLMTESVKQAAKDDPARLAGNIAGGILLGKASLKGAGSIGKGKVATGEIKSFKVDTTIKGSGLDIKTPKTPGQITSETFQHIAHRTDYTGPSPGKMIANKLDIAPSVPSTAKPVTMADAIFGKPTIRLRESVPVKNIVRDVAKDVVGKSPDGPYKSPGTIVKESMDSALEVKRPIMPDRSVSNVIGKGINDALPSGASPTGPYRTPGMIVQEGIGQAIKSKKNIVPDRSPTDIVLREIDMKLPSGASPAGPYRSPGSIARGVFDTALPKKASPTGPYKPVKSILRDEIRNVVNKYPGGKQKVRPSREPRGLTSVQPKKQPTWGSDQMEPVMSKRRPGEIPRDMPFDEPTTNVRVKKFIDQKYPTPDIAGGAKGKKFKTSADIFKPVKDTGVSTPSGSGGQMLLQVQKVEQVPKVTQAVKAKQVSKQKASELPAIKQRMETMNEFMAVETGVPRTLNQQVLGFRISEVAKTKSKAKTKQVQKVRQKQATKQVSKTRPVIVPKIASRAMVAIVPVQIVSTGSAQEILQVPVQKQEHTPIQKQKVGHVPKQKVGQVPKQEIMQDEILDQMPITEVVEKQMIRPHRKRKLLTIEGSRDPKKKSRKKSGKSHKVGGKVKKQQWYNPMDISFGEV